jgi:hypothetical protein
MKRVMQMPLIRRIFVFSAVVFIAGSSLGLALPILAQKAAAATACDPPSIMFGRYRWCGYFYNKFIDEGPSVRDGGVPAGVNNASDFINLVEGDYASGDAHKITEAVFVVREMIGAGLPTPPCALNTCKTLTAAQFKDFEDRVKAYANTSENGSVSTGTNGSIQWFHSDYMHCGDFNSYYQEKWHDIAPFIIDTSNTPDCNNSAVRFDHIEFLDKSGNVLWKIRRPCMNPIGTIKPLATAPPQYNLTPSITATSGGSALTSGSYVQEGDPITFTYNVNNSMADTATGISCQAHANDTTGWKAIPSPAETTGATPSGVTCKSSFTSGNNNLGTETIASAPNDTSLCRSLIVNPSSPTAGAKSSEICVYVSSRPYMRVYGGDVSAGNPQPSACGTTTNAGIVGWSKDLISHSGAGAQYAALAISSIYDYATSLGNGAGAATAGSGLAFANTGASGDTYGGSFGSLPCITDYYANKTGGTFTGGAIGGNNGSFTANGPITVSGSVNAATGQKFVLYVNGNVTINGNITYAGNFDPSNMPIVEIVASGSIFIDRSVTQLDGLYVAQANGTAGSGTIYTCTNLATQYTVDATGAFNSACHSTLTVNGAFVANQVRFLRTNGTVKQSSAGEAPGSNQAEVFNYSPALWMAQLPNIPADNNYDSITSLPPIL